MKKILLKESSNSSPTMSGITLGGTYDVVDGYFTDNVGTRRLASDWLFSSVPGSVEGVYKTLIGTASLNPNWSDLTIGKSYLVNEGRFKDDIGDIRDARYWNMVPGDSLPDDTAALEESKAKRYNQGKPQLSYILQGTKSVEGLAKVLEFGATKYERGNWLKGLDKNELVDSLLRHLTSFVNGEVLDQESNLPHVDHIHFNAKALAEFGDRECHK